MLAAGGFAHVPRGLKTHSLAQAPVVLTAGQGDHADGRLLVEQHAGQGVGGGSGGPRNGVSGALQRLCLGRLHLRPKRRRGALRLLLRRRFGLPEAPLLGPHVGPPPPSPPPIPQKAVKGQSVCALHYKLAFQPARGGRHAGAMPVADWQLSDAMRAVFVRIYISSCCVKASLNQSEI